MDVSGNVIFDATQYFYNRAKDVGQAFTRIWNQDAAEKKYQEAQDPNTNLYTTQFFKFVNNPYLDDAQFRETLSSTSREKYLTEFEDKNKKFKKLG